MRLKTVFLMAMMAFPSPCFADQPVKTAEEAIALVKQCLLRNGGANLPEMKDHWHARKMLLGWRVWSGIWGGGNWELSKGIHVGFPLDRRPDPDFCVSKDLPYDAAKTGSPTIAARRTKPTETAPGDARE